jgi:hypothetical protein
LDAVAQAELGQDPADVNFHGALGQEQAGRDLAVGPAGRDAGEDVLLAAGEGLPQLGARVGARLSGLRAGGELANEAGSGGRREDGVARRGRARWSIASTTACSPFNFRCGATSSRCLRGSGPVWKVLRM